jgi:hypothetical protein
VTFAGAPLCGTDTYYPAVSRYDLLTGRMDIVDRLNDLGQENGCPAGGPYESADPQISGDGRYIAFSSQGTNLVRDDTNGHWDVFVRDAGTDLDAAVADGSPRISLVGDPGFAACGLAVASSSAVPNAALDAAGAGLMQASLAVRPRLDDLFLRLDLSQFPAPFANSTIVYGLALSVGGTHYEVRANAMGPVGVFGLFRRTPGGESMVSRLSGSYGITGQQIIVTLPLTLIKAQAGAQLSAVEAFSAIGGYLTGIEHRLAVIPFR